MEQQLLLDLKEQFLEWSNMLQSNSELGGSAMAGILSLNEKYLQKIERALLKHVDDNGHEDQPVKLTEALEASKSHIVSFNRHWGEVI